MKVLPVVSVLAGAVASTIGQTIELGAPTAGTVVWPDINFTAQVIQPASLGYCTQVGIALAINNCRDDVCPRPEDQLGTVLYAGPWTPTPHAPGGYYQNFTLQVPGYMPLGPAIFTLTHLCLLGAGPSPLLEFRNATVTID